MFCFCLDYISPLCENKKKMGNTLITENDHTGVNEGYETGDIGTRKLQLMYDLFLRSAQDTVSSTDPEVVVEPAHALRLQSQMQLHWDTNPFIGFIVKDCSHPRMREARVNQTDCRTLYKMLRLMDDNGWRIFRFVYKVIVDTIRNRLVQGETRKLYNDVRTMYEEVSKQLPRREHLQLDLHTLSEELKPAASLPAQWAQNFTHMQNPQNIIRSFRAAAWYVLRVCQLELDMDLF